MLIYIYILFANIFVGDDSKTQIHKWLSKFTTFKTDSDDVEVVLLQYYNIRHYFKLIKIIFKRST